MDEARDMTLAAQRAKAFADEVERIAYGFTAEEREIREVYFEHGFNAALIEVRKRVRALCNVRQVLEELDSMLPFENEKSDDFN